MTLIIFTNVSMPNARLNNFITSNSFSQENVHWIQAKHISQQDHGIGTGWDTARDPSKGGGYLHSKARTGEEKIFYHSRHS